MTPPDTTPDPLLAHLADHDAECPVCGYGLRGITSPICPECAAPLHLAVASERTGVGPWLVGVIACALALGFDAVVFVLIAGGATVTYASRGVLPLQPVVMGGLFGAFALASGIALGAVLRSRRSWARRPRRSQWVTGWAIFGGVGLAHVGFAVLLIATLN